ncbi:5134_t:CDS:2, partial [Scutellospora calospora]
LESNKARQPLSITVLRQYLLTKGHERERRNLLHKFPNNVAYRYQYLQNRLSNLQGKNHVPKHPEVFLDELYCHLHHTTNKTWVPHKGVVLELGHKLLIIIFDTIIVFWNCNTNKLEEEWNDILNFIKNSNITPNQNDYHGNFNSDHYSKNFVPITSSKKAKIIEWLENKQIFVSEKVYKSKLLEIVKRYKEKVLFAYIEIAKHYVKNEVSVSGPHNNLLEIRNKLLYAFVEKKSEDYMLLIDDELDNEIILVSDDESD